MLLDVKSSLHGIKLELYMDKIREKIADLYPVKNSQSPFYLEPEGSK